MKIIGHIHTDFPTKFGLPRQSGLVCELKGTIQFEPEYRNPEAFRGLDGFSHIWLLWKFSESKREHWSATVKPPRLGGKKRMGVFATRSPFRPNDIGLSCVRLEGIEFREDVGPLLQVAGIDLMDGTPIYDIKPYIFTDCHPEATEGFAGETKQYELQVTFPLQLLEKYPKEKRAAIVGVLKQDPRPAYDRDPERIYGVEFAGFDVRFTVKEEHLTVCEVLPL
ncbi:MAG: tRNA (N6-threonylcarbamoyladenosine(37)-N6)-methyltransferase TrmO [Lachnospiraceae bacterium]|nr:tRNA (N6-threonylcarbamoyladenosine(37)-N6)-methyltransferase TrmO [Lachnospiraceae bacterium]